MKGEASSTELTIPRKLINHNKPTSNGIQVQRSLIR
jgi:hypothetical protein